MKYTADIDKIQRNLYMDDFVLGGNNIPEVNQLQATIIKIFGKANFKLQDWYSNIKELNDNDDNDGQMLQNGSVELDQKK